MELIDKTSKAESSASTASRPSKRKLTEPKHPVTDDELAVATKEGSRTSRSEDAEQPPLKRSKLAQQTSIPPVRPPQSTVTTLPETKQNAREVMNEFCTKTGLRSDWKDWKQLVTKEWRVELVMAGGKDNCAALWGSYAGTGKNKPSAREDACGKLIEAAAELVDKYLRKESWADKLAKTLKVAGEVREDDRSDNPAKALVSVDVEWYERVGPSGERKITEVGVCVLPPRTMAQEGNTKGDGSSTPAYSAYHFIVDEHYHLRNKIVGDHKDDFNFGKSVRVGLAQLTDNINAILREQIDGWVLVGHAMEQDKKMLGEEGVDIAGCGSELDAGLLFAATYQLSQMAKLEKMLEAFGMEGCNFHNGGNDAVYTLELAVKLLSSA